MIDLQFECIIQKISIWKVEWYSVIFLRPATDYTVGYMHVETGGFYQKCPIGLAEVTDETQCSSKKNSNHAQSLEILSVIHMQHISKGILIYFVWLGQ